MRRLKCGWMTVLALGLVSCAAQTEDVSWLIVQDAEGLSFAFDDAADAACPEDAFWSGTMTMTGVGEETFWFSGEPYRDALTQPTGEFVASFDEAFTPESGGNPNAVLRWEDAIETTDRAIGLELSSPSFDVNTITLSYTVCGLRPDALPDDRQVEPEAMPNATGQFSLIISDTTCPFADLPFSSSGFSFTTVFGTSVGGLLDDLGNGWSRLLTERCPA